LDGIFERGRKGGRLRGTEKDEEVKGIKNGGGRSAMLRSRCVELPLRLVLFTSLVEVVQVWSSRVELGGGRKVGKSVGREGEVEGRTM
jgi:hypothetical protein